MGSIISVLVLALPFIRPALTKFLPWLMKKGVTVFGKGAAKGGIIGAILAGIQKIGSLFGRFPKFLIGLFGAGGSLYWLTEIIMFIAGAFKTPVLLFATLVLSSFFPTILEKIFLLVGAISLKFLLLIIKIGKNAMSKLSASEGGSAAMDEFKQAVLGSFDELPPCFVDMMGYVHFLECLGMIVMTAMFVTVVLLVRTVYGGFITGNRHGLG